jgi:PAS domain S-box-containing protein
LTTAPQRLLLNGDHRSSSLESIVHASSVRLAKCSISEVDGAIVSALQDLCRTEDADQAGWFLLLQGSQTVERYASVLTSGILDRLSWPHSHELPWCRTTLLNGQAILITSLAELPTEAEVDLRNLRRLGIRSLALIPLDAGEGNRCVLAILSTTHPSYWSANLERHCVLLGSVFLSAHARKVSFQQKEISDSHFRELFRSASIGMAIEDTSGGLLYVNDALCTMLGWAESEMVQRRCVEFSHPADQPREAVLFEQLLNEEIQSYNIEKRFIHRSGAVVWARVTVTLLSESPDGSRLILGIAGDITAQKNAVEQLATSQIEVQSLASRLILSQEDERQSIARELQDDIGQRLSMVTSQIHLLRTEPRRDDQSGPVSLERVSEELDTLVTDLNNLSYRMHTSKLQHLGVKPALLEVCHSLEHSGLYVDLALGEDLEFVPEEIAFCLLRVAQEALDNVLKHSGRDRAQLSLSKTITGYYLVIKDTGKGFDSKTRPKGVGLISMRERVRPLHGDLVVSSTPNQGTEIAVWLPLPVHQNSRCF